jgi:hypothetical protein
MSGRTTRPRLPRIFNMTELTLREQDAEQSNGREDAAEKKTFYFDLL